ncbi:probable LRR receptor-like serine threonine-kinase At2g16250, partial [Olea europaea subsp. europaea]
MGISFRYKGISQATRDFRDENLIKHGQSGNIFLGTLEESFSVKISMELEILLVLYQKIYRLGCVF